MLFLLIVGSIETFSLPVGAPIFLLTYIKKDNRRVIKKKGKSDVQEI